MAAELMETTPDPFMQLGLSLYERFTLVGRLADAESSITTFERALSLTPQGNENILWLLDQLYVVRYALFRRTNDPIDLDKALETISRAVNLTPDDHADLPVRLNTLAGMYQARFECYEALMDVDEAIKQLHRAVSLAGDENPRLSQWLDNLGFMYRTRFQRRGEVSDIKLAIYYVDRAVSLVYPQDPSLPKLLTNQGHLYDIRYRTLGKVTDADKALDCLTKSLSSTPENHPERPERLANLGDFYQSRSKLLGEVSDIDRAIELLNLAVTLTPEGHPARAHLLGSLGNSYEYRFNFLGEPSDSERAIECLILAVSLTHDGDSDRPLQLANLGGSLATRFTRLGGISHINNAIDHLGKALSLTPDLHDGKSLIHFNLGNSFHIRFEHLGNFSDVQNAIKHLTQAVSLTADDHVEKPMRLAGLGNSYEHRFAQSGEITDIDKSVENLSRAVSLGSEEHPSMPRWLYNLGSSYHTRFGRLGDFSDIEKAIPHLKQAIALAPSQLPVRRRALALLSYCYRDRYDRLGGLVDLSCAIDFGSQAVHLLPSGYTSDISIRDSLGNAYRARFEHTGDLSDIRKAIDYQSEGLSVVPVDHTARPALLNNLANSYESRFKVLVAVDDIDKAILHRREAVRLIQQQENLPTFLLNLGVSYELRFSYRSELTGVEEAIRCFQQAAKSLNGHPYIRLRSARKWGRLAFDHQTSSLLEAYQHVMTFIPQVVWLGSSVNVRYDWINLIEGVVVEAAMVAIVLREFDTALEWLEGGRSIVWNQMLQLRTPLDRLHAVDATLARELERVSKDLNTAHEAISEEAGPILDAPTSEQSGRQQRSLAAEWGELVGRARQIAGFQDFLEPKKISELTQAADSGTVVMINVHKHRCDALALLPRSGSVIHIPLPSLSLGACVKMKEKRLGLLRGPNLLTDILERTARTPIFYPDHAPQDELQALLEDLWTDVVEPVLNALGYSPNRTDELPHLTWCTTGPPAFLPLHAAGIYSEPQVKAFDFVVSSYTPTVGALLKQTNLHKEFRGILAVGQDFTPGYTPLPGTIDELDHIQRQAESLDFTRLDGDSANPVAVLSAMRKHSWVHLACHASQDTSNPSESAFHLHGGRLSLSRISQTSLEHAQLAFLSACQTARGDEKLPEEAVHLAAGMIMAGYSTVIATMWSIDDVDAPIVAKEFYSRLIEGGAPDARNAARALHDAVGSLRDK
ncbi:hypothetical protein FRC10_010282, partial [Ceratobasidium sp. 414]